MKKDKKVISKITLEQINELKTKNNKSIHSSSAKFSNINPMFILKISGYVEDDKHRYWWNKMGYCFSCNPKSPDAVRHPKYDLDFSTLKAE